MKDSVQKIRSESQPLKSHPTWTPQVSTQVHRQRIHTQGYDWIFKDLLLTTMKEANIFFIQTHSTVATSLSGTHTSSFTSCYFPWPGRAIFSHLLLHWLGIGQPVPKGVGKGPKHPSEPSWHKEAHNKTSRWWMLVQSSERKGTQDLCHLSLSMEVGFLPPSSVKIGTQEAENATRRKFMERGFLLPPGEAARHSSRHLRTQNLKAQVQISTLLEDQCHMSVPSHPSCPNTADSREET